MNYLFSLLFAALALLTPLRPQPVAAADVTPPVTTAAPPGGNYSAPQGVSLSCRDTPAHPMGGALQGVPLDLTGEVVTVAGSAGQADYADGTGTAARFSSPGHVATDGKNLYVTEYVNHTIRMIDLKSGAVTTLAGTPGVSGSDDGIGSAALFYSPTGITTDGNNLYVTDYGNHTIRKIVIATAEVTTLAGNPQVSGADDGTGQAATFFFPLGITTDGTNLFVADSGNHTIRAIVIATGEVTTLAGTAGTTGAANGSGAAATFWGPADVTTDGPNLYVVENANNTIRRIDITTRQVSTLAGTPGVSGSDDGIGSAALFSGPYGITTDGTSLFVSDTFNQTIRRVVIADGTVTTLAGSPGTGGATDGAGKDARFYYPFGLTTDGVDIFVADYANQTIRKLVGTSHVISGCAATFYCVGASCSPDLPYVAGDLIPVPSSLILRFYSRDNAGNTEPVRQESYTIAVPPPFVAATLPTPGASEVPLTSSIVAIFDQAMDPATITTDTFTLQKGIVRIAGAASYDAATRTATFSPSGGLSPKSVYAATIGTGVRSLAGIPLSSPKIWYFFTASHPVRLLTAAKLPAGTFPTIGDAYGIAENGATIQVMNGDLTGDITLNRMIGVTISGGYDASFTNRTGSTLYQGALTVTAGSVVIDGLGIR